VEQILDHKTYKEASAGCPAALSKSLMADFPEFEAVSRVILWGNIILTVSDNQKISQRAFYADSAFFTIFSFPGVRGDLTTALDAPYSVVLTQTVAKKIFGEQDPLGKTIRFFDDDQDHKVTGIIQDVPQNSHFTFDLLISSVSITAGSDRDPFEAWHNNWVPLYVLLHPEQPWQKASEKIQFALKKYQGEETRHELYLRPLSRIHLYANVRHEFGLIGSIKNIYIFSAIAIFVLIIAGINFMNLTTARSADRAQEVGLRKVSGAQRTSLIQQFLGESIFMAFMAMFFAIILMKMLLPEFNRIVNRDLFLSFLENWPFVLGILFITLLTGLLSGIYPAFVLSSFKPANVLKGSFSSGSKNVFLRKSLVVLQFFISVTLISGTMIILQQVNYLLHKDLGYNTEQILTFDAGSADVGTYRVFKNQILQNPKVIHVATADYMMHSSTNWTRASWEGATEGEWMKINVNYIDEDLIETYGMTVVKGRAFSREYGSDRGNVVILNETAVREIGWEEPIGKNIRYWGDYKLTNIGSVEVVGVVKDYHFLSLHNPVTPLMLRLFPEDVTGWNVSVKVSGQDIPKTIAFIENKFKGLFPESVFDYRFLDEDFGRMYSEERKSGKVILYLTLLAMFIACLGLFGLASFATKQRTKEIGIRKVIGATIPHIMWLLNSEFLKLTVLGCFLAWPVAYFVMGKWLQNFPYRVSIQWWVFLLSSLAACVVALLSISYQSIKSATANPVDSLRYE
jgi:putative ABC transport system permease protein